MAAPLLREDKARIMDYLGQIDLSELTGFKIKELVKENLGIIISQPTASKLKREIEDQSDDMEFLGDDASEEIAAMAEPTEPKIIRRLSQEQMNVIDSILKGQSDRAIAEAVGVSRQTVWEWRNNDPLFIAELNRQRIELWSEARERLKSLANRALDVVEYQLNSRDPKAALAAAKYVLQGTRLLGDTELHIGGPTTPESVIMERLRSEARKELWEEERRKPKSPMSELDLFREMDETNFKNRIEDLAQSRLKGALSEAGLL